MRINQAVIYAATVIDELQANETKTLTEISKKHSFSEMFLQQVARKLKLAGILGSVRGPGGGYYLKREQITLLELMTIYTERRKGQRTYSKLENKLREALNGISILN